MYIYIYMDIEIYVCVYVCVYIQRASERLQEREMRAPYICIYHLDPRALRRLPRAGRCQQLESRF